MSLEEELCEFHKRTGASHYHSSLSALPILQEIKAKKREEDIFILGKAHAVTAYNLVFGVDMDGPIIHNEFASLGSGLPAALGKALLYPNKKVFVLCGDGEFQEGSCHEALLAMTRLGLTNIDTYVDVNGMQAMGECPLPSYPEVHYRRTVKGKDWTCHYASA